MSAPSNPPASALLAVCLLGGCAVGPDFHRPAAPAATHFTQGTDPEGSRSAAGTAQHFQPGASVPRDWWQLFHSAALDAAIDEALARDPGLEAAQASLRQSQDNLRSGYGIFYPAVEAQAAATRERFSGLQIGQMGAGRVFNLFTLSASVNYALDVFGGQRRLVEGLHAQVDVADATATGTYLTLATNIANTVIARAAYQAEADATRELIELQRSQVHLAEVQAEAGTVPYSTVLSLRSQLASFEASIPRLEQQIAQSDDLLSALAGHTPAEWTAPPVKLSELTLPAELPVSVPSALVRQRPDILAAEAVAHAASAQVGVATAAMLPSVNLSGAVSTSSNQASGLFAGEGRGWSINGTASVPLFEGGTLWYKRRAAVAGYQQASALYRQTVLAAFEQVADVLNALEHDAEALEAQQESLDSARQALRLVHANYQAGLATYLDELNADAQYHEAQIAVLEATALRYQDTVALFAALGGGWWNRRSP